MKFKSLKGTEDILPEKIGLWQKIEKRGREIFSNYGYHEIRTPVIEDTDLFYKSTGETTDIVEKEMYTIEKESGESISLRPEFTPSVVRAYIEHSMYKKKKFQKMFYFGPLFRHEKPQAGRSRQFNQFGVEALGSYDPLIDVETISSAQFFLKEIGVEEIEVNLNSIGCPKCRENYKDELRSFLKPKLKDLCEDCNRRFDKNIFRTLDCKNEACAKTITGFPTIENFLCEDCKNHFSTVENGLESIDIEYKIDPQMARGLDYYTKTVYEINCPALGAKNSLVGGGRYDNLVENFGGPPTGAVGFGLGIERTILAIEKYLKDGNRETTPKKIDFFITTTSAEERDEAFKLLDLIRRSGLCAEMDFEGRSLKSQMRLANKLNSKNVILLGPEEMKKNELKLKDMNTGEESKIKIDEFKKKRINL